MSTPQPTPAYVAIRYMGQKAKKPDNVLNRNVVWLGHGDVKFVPIADAIVYANYPAIWAYAPEVEVPTDGTPFSPHPSAASLQPPPLTPPAEVGAEAAEELAEKLAQTSGPADRFTAEEMSARVQEVIRAIPAMPKKAFGQDGKPLCGTLSIMLNRPVYKAERDAAWEQLCAVLREGQNDLASGDAPG